MIQTNNSIYESPQNWWMYIIRDTNVLIGRNCNMLQRLFNVFYELKKVQIEWSINMKTMFLCFLSGNRIYSAPDFLAAKIKTLNW